MKKTILFCLLFLMNLGFVEAQNAALLDRQEAALNTDYNNVFPKDAAATGDMNEIVRNLLWMFRKDHLDRQIDEPYFYSFTNVLDAANPALVEVLKNTFLKNKKIYEKVYGLMRPLLQDIFKKMTKNENEIFLKLIRDGIDYTEKFDLAKETADLEELDYNFLYEKGHLQAFIYRRISNKQLSQKECLYWLNKVLKDLSGATNPSTRPEDNFYITDNIGMGYYSARQMGNYDHQLFIKDGEKYKPALPTDYKSIVYMPFDDLILVQAQKDQELVVFALFKDKVSPPLPSGVISNAIPVAKNLYALLKEDSWNQKAFVWVDPDQQTATLINPSTEARYLKDFLLIIEKNKLYVCANNKLGDIQTFDLQATIDLDNRYEHKDLIIVSHPNQSFALRMLSKEKVEWLALPSGYTWGAITATTNKDGKDYFVVGTKEGKWGMLSPDFKIAIEPIYDNLEFRPTASVLIAQKADKYLLLDIAGKAIIPEKYKEIVALGYGNNDQLYFKVGEAGKYALFDKTGKQLSDFSYKELTWAFNKGAASYFTYTNDKDKYGILSDAGKPITAALYDGFDFLAYGYSQSDWQMEYFIFEQKDAQGKPLGAVFSTDFKQLSPFQYQTFQKKDTIITFDPDTFQEIEQVVETTPYVLPIENTEFSRLKMNGKSVLVDNWGKVIIPNNFLEIELLSYAPLLFKAGEAGKWTLLDGQGKQISGFFTDITTDFKCGDISYLICTNEKGKKGIFDWSGKPLTEVLYEGFYTNVHYPRYSSDAEMPSVAFVIIEQKDAQGKKLGAIFSKDLKQLSPFQYEGSQATYITEEFDPETFESIDSEQTGYFYIYGQDDGSESFILKMNGKSVKVDASGKEVK